MSVKQIEMFKYIWKGEKKARKDIWNWLWTRKVNALQLSNEYKEAYAINKSETT